tara:strand:- start:168 stop:419 length:252 start_codon:yes stop_codon:yes gene_type:complete
MSNAIREASGMSLADLKTYAAVKYMKIDVGGYRELHVLYQKNDGTKMEVLFIEREGEKPAISTLKMEALCYGPDCPESAEGAN